MKYVLGHKIAVGAVILAVFTVGAVAGLALRRVAPGTQPGERIAPSQSSGDVEKAAEQQTSASEEKATPTGGTVPSDIDLRVYTKTPKISEFSLGTSTFTVIHWGADESDFTSAVAVYVSENRSGTEPFGHRSLYSDLDTSCGQPYTYGMVGDYFYVSKDKNPCEAVNRNTTLVYDKTGKLTVTYHLTSGMGQSFSYQLGDGQPQAIELVQDKSCDSFPVNADGSVPSGTEKPEITIKGIKVGDLFIPLKPAKTLACDFIEMGDAWFEDPWYSVQPSGTAVTVDLPTGEKLMFDVRKPREYQLK